MNLDALEFNNHFLNQIIFHSIQDTEFISKIRQIIPVSIFKAKEKEIIIKMIYNFYDDFKTAPGENFFDIFQEQEKNMSEDLYNRCINFIGVLKDITGSNPEYILRNINDAIYHFQLEEASIDFATLIKNKKYDEAKGVILKAIKEKPIEQPYYDFFTDNSFISERINKNRYKMKTKIPKLDEMIGGFGSDWLITILGATKGGKTWTFIELAIAAVLQGLNVLFISLEMGKKQIDERFDMAIGFMSSEENQNKITDTIKKVGKDWIPIKEKVPSIYNINEVIKNRQKIKKIGGGNLKIMAFKKGRLNYLDITRVIDELEEEGFYTDVIIVDYLGLMRATETGQDKKERISENCSGLKEICGERNIIGISGMQGNRKAMTAKVFHSYLVADDIDTIFVSDLVIAICQTTMEEKNNKARFYIANYRHGKQHGQVGVIRDLNIGQVALDSFEVKENDFEEEEIKVTGVDF